MAIEITMPRMSDTMEQGTVVKWHVKEGDTVSTGDVLADIETDKATMELECFDDGIVAKLAAGEGENVAVGDLIVVLAEEGEDPGDAASSAGSGKKDTKQKTEGGNGDEDSGGGASTATEQKGARDAGGNGAAARGGSGGSGPDESGSDAESDRASANGSAGEGGRIFASPLARKIAADTGVDLSSINGTGPSGRIVKRDVEKASSSGGAGRGGGAAGRAEGGAAPMPAPTPMEVPAELEDRTVSLSNMRATIAKRLVESKTTVPHYQVTVSARMDALEELRGQLNEQLAPQGVKLSVNDFLVRACALAMHRHPFVNSSWEPKGPSIRLHGRVNVGVAVALPEERGGGLVVATLRDADRIGLRQISSETKRLAKKAREKGLTVEEMSDSTFTISNLGMFGVDHFTAIINPPNAAILAVGRAVQKPFIETDEDGETVITVGSEMSMTMSSDHRIIDGAMAAQYLATVKDLLEKPATLLV